MWGSNLRTVAPGQTYILDVKAIRDSQIKGSEGNTIPLDARVGHVTWSWYPHGESPKPLIGRSQTVNIVKRMSSTYECLACECQVDNVNDQRMLPSPVTRYVGESETFIAQEQHVGCFPEIPSSWFNAFGVSWNTLNSSVATVNSAGTATAVGPGTATITGTWQVESHTWIDGANFCNFNGTYNVTAQARFTAQVPQPHHVRVIVDQGGYPAECPTTAVYLRQIRVQIVTMDNKDIKRNDLNISETLSDISTNTCGNGSPSGSNCEPNFGGGTFIDSMTVSKDYCGSGINRNSGCGYTVKSLWKACAGSGWAAADIWRYNGETRSNGVKVNGRADPYPAGTELFP
jgi:hypothetical protein